MNRPGPKGITNEQILAAIDQTGSQAGAAAFLGIHKRSIERRVRSIKDGTTAEDQHAHQLEQRDDEIFKGRSVLWNPETGERKLEWYKTDRDKQVQLEQMREVIEGMKEDIPRAKPVTPPASVSNDLCACYVLSDAHIGMLAWGEETGEDWDTKIAEETIKRWTEAAMQSAPNAHTAVLLQLGDWLHFDGLIPETPTSKHSLDTDTRFQLLIRVAVRTLRYIMQLLLQKHKHVHVIMADANHDPASSAWLREMFAVLYENDPRVNVDTSADTYYAFRWGDVSIFAHHGHKSKVQNVSQVFAGKLRELYGTTSYSYAHVGHLHHAAMKEDQMMVTEQHTTLAARDAYAAKGGYISQRGASVITYHKKYGEVARNTIKPEMLY